MSQEHLGPRIKVSNKISDGQTPYAVGINRDAIGGFLMSQGVQERDLPNVQVIIPSKDLDEASNTEYNDRNDIDISVSAAYAWEMYEKSMRAADNIANGGEVINKPFEDILYTKRLPKYLQSAPKDRALKTAQKLLANGVTREFNGSLMHELVHAVDILTGRHKFWYSDFGVKISNIFDFARNVIDASERGATKFERKNRNNPSHRDMLSIAPRKIV